MLPLIGRCWDFLAGPPGDAHVLPVPGPLLILRGWGVGGQNLLHSVATVFSAMQIVNSVTGLKAGWPTLAVFSCAADLDQDCLGEDEGADTVFSDDGKRVFEKPGVSFRREKLHFPPTCPTPRGSWGWRW